MFFFLNILTWGREKGDLEIVDLDIRPDTHKTAQTRDLRLNPKNLEVLKEDLQGQSSWTVSLGSQWWPSSSAVAAFFLIVIFSYKLKSNNTISQCDWNVRPPLEGLIFQFSTNKNMRICLNSLVSYFEQSHVIHTRHANRPKKIW